MKVEIHKLLSILFIFGLLAFGFNNCSPVHEGEALSGGSLSSLGVCGEDLARAYEDSFYRLAKEQSNCADCHSYTYTNKDASFLPLADDDFDKAMFGFFNDDSPYVDAVAIRLGGTHSGYNITKVPATDIENAKADFEQAYGDYKICEDTGF